MLNIDEVPTWVLSLQPEDLNFIKRFVICSGSLKELAVQYEVSYPTVRIRLDKLIEKIKAADSPNKDPFVDYIKSLALDGKISIETAKDLLSQYKKGDNHAN